MIRHYSYIIFSLLLFALQGIKGQPAGGYINPMAHSPLLSGNFGELRPNHFHAGVDFRTEGMVGKPVVSVADGYVSRISIDAGGYGKKLYITHPATGETSVYAHLDRFAPPLDEVVRAYQYAHQTFCFDISFSPDSLPIKQGAVAAYSGNTGGSRAPHLHFELHDTQTGAFIDPLHYGFGVEDDVKPHFFALKLYPQRGEGSLNNGSNNKVYALSTNERGETRFVKPPAAIRAWGRLGTSIRALDYMNNTGNVFGIRSITLEVDGQVVSHYRNAEFGRNDLRSINSVIDYEAFCQSGAYYLKAFVEEGNLSDLYETAVNQGFILINEERNYHIKYTLADALGNRSVFNFTIKGEKPKQPLAKAAPCLCRMFYDFDNRFDTEEVSLVVPKHALYADICFRYDKAEAPNAYSALHRLHTECTPLHAECEVAIRLTRGEVRDSAGLYVENVNYSGRRRACMGSLRHGIYTIRTRELGSFVVRADSVAPVVSRPNISQAKQEGIITCRISDAQTGIGSYNGYIDERWVLFEYDQKSAQIRCRFTEREVTRHKHHHLKLIVSDKAGNERVVEKNFYW